MGQLTIVYNANSLLYLNDNNMRAFFTAIYYHDKWFSYQIAAYYSMIIAFYIGNKLKFIQVRVKLSY